MMTSALLLSPLSSTAAPSSTDRATATQLFEDAQKSSATGNFRDACVKYAESQRLDPQLGTLLHLADCNEKVGLITTAWTDFKDAIEIAAARADPREAIARARVAMLEPKLPRLVIEVPAPAPGDLEVQRDGHVVAPAVWGSAVPVDPGTHVIVAKASGYKPWITTVELKSDGAIVRVAVRPVEAERVPADVRKSPVASHGTSQRTIGYVVGGVGLAGLVVGTVFLVRRASKVDERNSVDCPMDTCSSQDKAVQIEQLTDQARTAATTATVGFIVGGAAIAAGGVLVLTSPSPSASARWTVQPWFARAGAGAAISGVW
ncbi:MAG TPA: hypothetical protein VF881_01070 [Polyangiaceae bacterium]